MSSTHHLHRQFAILFFVGVLSEFVLAQKVLDESGAVYSGKDGCCITKARQYIDKGKKNNEKYCAVLFENAACDSCKRIVSGWDEGIKEGKRIFPKLSLTSLSSRFREDSASVVVAPGCIFVGYDEDKEEKDVKKRQQEKRAIVSAIGRTDWIYKEFKELKNDIERVECYCGLDGANKLGKELERLGSVKCKGGTLNYAASGIGGAIAGGIATQLLKDKLG